MATVRYVNTNNSVSGDGTTNETDGSGDSAFVSLLAAINSLPSTLIDQVTIYCDGTAADTSDVNQTPWDFETTATFYLLVTTQGAARHNGIWSTSKYRLTATNRNVLYNNTPAHIRFDGLQVHLTVSDANGYIAVKGTNANQTAANVDTRISNMMIRATLTSGTAIGIENRPWDGGTTGVVSCWNNIVFDCTQGANGDVPGSDSRYWNNTFVDNTYGMVDDEGTMVAINNLVSGATIGFVGTFDGTSNYNAEDDGNGAPGANSLSAATFTFVNEAADDFHLQSGSDGVNDGVSDPGAGMFSDDIDGQARTGSWDIGADEFAIAAITTEYVAPTVLQAGVAMIGRRYV